MRPSSMRNMGNYNDCEEIESYEDYKERINNDADRLLFAAVSKILSSSLKEEDKKEFGNQAGKLLIETLIKSSPLQAIEDVEK